MDEYDLDPEGESLNWLNFVKMKLGMTSGIQRKFVIYKVPRRLPTLYEDPYRPNTVSIGPLHCDKDNFIIGVDHKWRYANYFLCRVDSPSQALEECAEVIKECGSAARDSYTTSVLSFNDFEMNEMFLRDGLFMLEIFLRYSYDSQRENDPILENERWFQDLLQDLAMLENQIPFIILLRLFETMNKFMNGSMPYSLHRYVLFFFNSVLHMSTKAIDEQCELLANMKIEHILDMLHLVYGSSIRGISQQQIRIDVDDDQTEYIPGFELSALDLHKYGIQLEKGHAEHLLDVIFFHGIIKIPCLTIDRTTNSIFRKLIAYEQFGSGSMYHMSSYATLMGSLVKSSYDVKFLRQKGIIRHTSDAEDVVRLFEGLVLEANAGKFEFADLCAAVNSYRIRQPVYRRIIIWSTNFWNRSITTLIYVYFKDVWTTIKVAAAIILLVLTALQTVYTLKAYYHPRKS